MRRKVDVYTVAADEQMFDLLAYRTWTKPDDDCEPPEPDAGEAKRKLQLQRIEGLLDQLPDLEADVMAGRLKRISETQMAAMLGCSQPAVSQAMSSAIKRMCVLVQIPTMTRDRFGDDLRALVAGTVKLRGRKREQSIDYKLSILWSWWNNTSKKQVAAELQCAASYVQVVLDDFCAALMADDSAALDSYRDAFLLLRAHPNLRYRQRVNKWKAVREAAS